jgi:hypothetical protein
VNTLLLRGRAQNVRYAIKLRMYVCAHVCIYRSVYVYVVCVYVDKCSYFMYITYACMCECICIYVHLCVYVNSCV